MTTKPATARPVAIWNIEETPSGRRWYPANTEAVTIAGSFKLFRLRDSHLRQRWNDCKHIFPNGTPVPYPTDKVDLVV